MFCRCCAIFLFAALIYASLARDACGQDGAFVVTDPAQPISPFQFEDDQGHPLDLKDFRGRYVLLNLWATSCAPCAAEMPTLNALSKKLDPQKFAVIALAEDHDGRDAARLFYNRHGIDHLPIYDDPSGRAPFILHIRGLPTTLLIDPNGCEVARLEGAAEWTGDSTLSFLETQTTH
jgi:thiol-disulfide isomerase/thioredoxin